MLLPAVLAVGCSREADLPPAGALYRQYAARQELKVAQLSGYKLCDTVRVDVVMLQADGEEEWRQLAEEFGLRGTEGSESWLGEVDNPANRMGRQSRDARHRFAHAAHHRLLPHRRRDAVRRTARLPTEQTIK